MLVPRVLAACAALMLPLVTSQAIDKGLKPSKPTKDPISSVDISLNEFDRLTLKVGDQPFFFNGLQLRADKVRDVWGLSQSEIKSLYDITAGDGFTVVNTQLLWSEIQPDKRFNASESTYIQGGSSSNKNFASSSSSKFGYKTGSEGDKQLTYVKFDFSAYKSKVDSAKVRFYVDSEALGSKAFTANLFGITKNDWKASSITWASGAPNHNGVDVVGKKDEDYFLASSSPSWDTVLKTGYYDFDVSDFVKNHSPSQVASFILQASTDVKDAAIGASVHGAKGQRPPQLILSTKEAYDWTYLDTMIGWAESAGLKLELVWFGSDSTGVTMDSRVPYYVMQQFTKIEKLQPDGSHTPVFKKNTDPAYGVYWHYMDKNDLDLRKQEKAVIRAMMNHIAEYNRGHGSKSTVIGVVVANEPAIHKFHGSAFEPWRNPKTWGALSSFDSVQAFKDRTMWEFCTNLANAVKESDYPVWTRSNDVRGVDAAHTSYNENMRKSVGASVDFIGLDPYSNDVKTIFKFGHTTAFDGKSYDTGSNLPMIMENGGEYTNLDHLILASLAGGSLYNVYDLMSTDGHGMYVPKDTSSGDFTPVPRGSYVTDVRNTNKMLNKIALDLATKLPVGAGGKDLDFLNIFSNDTNVPGDFGKVDLAYEPADTSSVGIVDVRSSTEVAVLSTGDAQIIFSGIQGYGIGSVESGSFDGSSWVKSGSISYKTNGDDISIQIDAYQCVRVVTNKSTK
ncbi:hypothetical protein NW767_002393 [Fusarium falciforme]|nr:hypothetical protein NW767_002393 [Fusarium falciforme]KAJ4251197.1 hypothetical protein NW757_006743 [Fusarium falciforme]